MKVLEVPLFEMAPVEINVDIHQAREHALSALAVLAPGQVAGQTYVQVLPHGELHEAGILVTLADGELELPWAETSALADPQENSFLLVPPSASGWTEHHNKTLRVWAHTDGIVHRLEIQVRFCRTSAPLPLSAQLTAPVLPSRTAPCCLSPVLGSGVYLVLLLDSQLKPACRPGSLAPACSTDPCLGQPGKTWSEEKKQCVGQSSVLLPVVIAAVCVAFLLFAGVALLLLRQRHLHRYVKALEHAAMAGSESPISFESPIMLAVNALKVSHTLLSWLLPLSTNQHGCLSRMEIGRGLVGKEKVGKGGGIIT